MSDALKDLIQKTLTDYSSTDDSHLYGIEAATERRRKTVERLMEGAADIIAEEGLHALTFRKLASRCEMRPGNLQYYFPSRGSLIHTLLRYIVANYMRGFLNDSFLELESPEKRLHSFIRLMAEDVQSKRTTAIFIAIWDLAQRDSFVASGVSEIYSVERALLRLMLTEIHPRKPEQEVAFLAGAISSLIEGLMPLFGPNTPPSARMDGIHDAAVAHACHLAGIDIG